MLNKKPNAFYSNYLKNKLLETFQGNIKVIVHNKDQVIIPSGAIVPSEIELNQLDDTDTIEKAAMILKTEIMKIKPKKLPHNATVTNLIEGECTKPDIVNTFFSTLLSCNKSRKKIVFNNNV